MTNKKLYEFDLEIRKKYNNILAFDESGRGCVAGDLVVVGVILKPNYYNELINDSKKIKSKQKRAIIAKDIIANCINFKVEFICPKQVDKLNPKQATINAMEKITNELNHKYDIILTDYEKINNIYNQINIVKGDQTSFSIAAASIVAKHYRDVHIEEINKKFPQYDLINNQGYLTKKHSEILKRYEPEKQIYRFSYKPIKEIEIYWKKQKNI